MAQVEESRAAVPRLGAWVEAGPRVRWRVWAPEHRSAEVVLQEPAGKPGRVLPMTPEPGGYFTAVLEGQGAGVRYKLRVDGEGPFPDPWSRSQPEGVHGPSEVVVPDFAWTDARLEGAGPGRARHLRGARGHGHARGHLRGAHPPADGAARAGHHRPGAACRWPASRARATGATTAWTCSRPQHTYGGPDGLRQLIDAAHAHGLAVLIDAVYNHFGPDGNYLRCYSPHYFTGRHHTPWGDAVNYDGERSAPVRELVLSNVEMWIRDYHADGLRLDATHAIVDDSSPHLLAEIAERARAAAPGRRVVVIAEDERNEARLAAPGRRRAAWAGRRLGGRLPPPAAPAPSRATARATTRTTPAARRTSPARCARAGSTRARCRRTRATRGARPRATLQPRQLRALHPEP